jgi:hypothetical protein
VLGAEACRIRLWCRVMPPARTVTGTARETDVHAFALDIDGADEEAVLVVVEDRAAVGAGEHQQAAVLPGAVVEGDADGEQVVVGVGVEGES